MAESAAYARRGFKGSAKGTKLQSQISAADTVIPCIDLSTWVGLTTNGPGCVVIDRNLATEEKIEFTGLAGNSLTGCTRGVDGTAPAGHSANAPVEHCLRARDVDEANAHIANPALDHHTQYVKGATLTTRGDIFTRGAAGVQRLALPVANRVLRSDGTDAVWGQIVTADITDANVTAAKLAASIPLGAMDYQQVTADQTGLAPGPTDLTSLTSTVTVAAGRRIRITGRCQLEGSVAGNALQLLIREGATTLTLGSIHVVTANESDTAIAQVVLTPTAAVHTYKLSVQRGSGAGTVAMRASATFPAFILVEDMGV